MLWIKSLHLIFAIAWFAGIFYLPRLFVYHAMAADSPSQERFVVMERKLYRGIMTPSMVLAIGFGAWLWLGYGTAGHWIHAKLVLVALLVAYHFWMGAIARAFANSPKILFADEPTGNLDNSTGHRIFELLQSLNSDGGSTIVLVTHDITLASRASRMIRLLDGAVVEDTGAPTVKSA